MVYWSTSEMKKKKLQSFITSLLTKRVKFTRDYIKKEKKSKAKRNLNFFSVALLGHSFHQL